MFRWSKQDWQGSGLKTAKDKATKERGSSRPAKSFTQVQQWFAKLGNENSARSFKKASQALEPDTKYNINDEEGFKGSFKWRTTEKDGVKFRFKVHEDSRRQIVAAVTTPFEQSGFCATYQRHPVHKGEEDATEPPGDHKHRFRVSMKSGETEFNTIDIRGPKKENATISLAGNGGKRKAVYTGFGFLVSEEYTLGKELKVHVKTEGA